LKRQLSCWTSIFEFATSPHHTIIHSMRRTNRRRFIGSGLLAGTGALLGSHTFHATAQAPANLPPGLPITDAHVHFWDPSHLDYPWLRSSPIGGPKLPADYSRETAPFKIEKLFFIQAECRRDQALNEVAWVEKLAAAEPRIAAIVAFAPIEDTKSLAIALEDFSRRPLVKGVRRLIQSEPEQDFCLRPGFIAGVRSLSRFKLVFEVGARDDQLPAVATLVEQCPEVSFVLDHLGNPRIKDGAFKPWDQNIRRLAALPNIACKVSGAATRADWKTWKPDQLKPYIDHVLNCFGFDRVMFGSDWPVCTQACTFDRWLEVLADATKGCRKDQLDRLFGKNARKFFRIA
jgi:L-fuconolactonase